MSIRPGDESLRCLYKYRELSGSRPDGLNANTVKLLEDGELFFSKPSAFNDPFDSKVDYDTNASENEIRDYLHRQRLPHYLIDNVLQQIKAGAVNLKAFSFHGASGYADLLNIFCLSKTATNILMWSHYAKDHTGICIGLKVHIAGNSLNVKVSPNQVLPLYAGHSNSLIPAVYVEYDDAKPKPYNIFKSDYNDLSPFFLRKSKLWEYEEELRLMVFDRLMIQNPVQVPKSELLEITFGLKSDPKLIQKVRDIVAGYPNGGKDVEFYKCVEVGGKYAVTRIKT